MSPARRIRDRAASIRSRLLERARARGEDFQLLLDRYAVERLLYRLSISPAKEDFLLKGALLFALWFDAPHRPTRDADFLGFGAPDADTLADALRAVCAIACDDGISFDASSIRIEAIREEAVYEGLRANLQATIGRARSSIQLDVGFGDAVTPAPVEITYPCLLNDLPAPRLRAYPRESVFAEKVEAIVKLGIANSRMKDYFDLLALVREGGMETVTLTQAIAATFSRRGTALPRTTPVGLSREFAQDAQKQAQWQAFLTRNRLTAPSLPEVIEELSAFLREPLQTVRASR